MRGAEVTRRELVANLRAALQMPDRSGGAGGEAEREYTTRLQRGELRPELLFPEDAQFAGRIARHPALLWKAQNARDHTKARGSR